MVTRNALQGVEKDAQQPVQFIKDTIDELQRYLRTGGGNEKDSLAIDSAVEVKLADILAKAAQPGNAPLAVNLVLLLCGVDDEGIDAKERQRRVCSAEQIFLLLCKSHRRDFLSSFGLKQK